MRIDPHDITTCLEDEGLSDTPGAPLSTPIVQTSLFSYPTFEPLIEALGADHERRGEQTMRAPPDPSPEPIVTRWGSPHLSSVAGRFSDECSMV
jgi:hypothetical protein